MNKKIIVAFGISIFLGLGYLAYRKTEVGRKLKSKWIIKRILKRKEDKNISWDYPEEVLAGTLKELMTLDFAQLEMIEKYVKLNLARKGSKVVYGYREEMKKKGIYEKTDLKNLELMMYNLFGIAWGKDGKTIFRSTVPDPEYLKGYEPAPKEKK